MRTRSSHASSLQLPGQPAQLKVKSALSGASQRLRGDTMLLLLRLALALVLLPAAVRAKLYGLSLVHNSPAQSKLVRIDSTEGNVTELGAALGPEHGAMSATSDLRAVDSKRGVYYFLGDTHAGTTLVGLKLRDGAQVCAGTVPFCRRWASSASGRA